jgi:8-oxo-dGTP diphosphatase
MVLRVDIEAAGAVIPRGPAKSPQILLIHRPKYDDWSFPKGKVDPGEHVVTAAVREVAEETGLDIRLSKPLPAQYYSVFPGGKERVKRVQYWGGTVIGRDDISGFRPNSEVDQVRWVSPEKAHQLLTYPHDRRTLVDFLHQHKKTNPLIILRHAKARSRKSWRGNDKKRPLTLIGEYQSEQLVALLNAYGVTRLVTSDSKRCSATVAPYADVAHVEIEHTADLSEENSTARSVLDQVEALMEAKEPAVLCTHRPVLPLVFEAAGVEAAALDPGAFLVVHHRKKKILATEQHVPPSGR